MMALEEHKWYQCFNCDAEFRVHNFLGSEDDETEDLVTFCPFCGEPLDSEAEDDWDETNPEPDQ